MTDRQISMIPFILLLLFGIYNNIGMAYHEQQLDKMEYNK